MIDNLATVQPPEFIRVGETAYPINTNYLCWIEVIEKLDDIDFDVLFDEHSTADAINEELKILEEIEALVFGTIIPEDPFVALKQITGFAGGYPKAKKSRGNKGARVVDFGLDLNSIIIAIRDQSGIDLSQPNATLHWWRFLLEFENLTADHHICKVMELRAYKGDDKDMIRARNAVALPIKHTRAEERQDREWAAIFYNC